MRVTAMSADALPTHPVAWGVPVATGDEGPRYAVSLDEFDLTLPGWLDPAWCKRRDFAGKVGQTLTLRSAAPAPVAPTEGDAPAPAEPASIPEIVLVGVGDPASFAGDRGLESLRRASAAFVRAAGSGESAVLLLAPVPDLPVGSSAEAAAVGAALAAYRYDDFRTGDCPARLEALVLAVGPTSDVGGADGGATRGARIAESVNLARDLVNEPPSSLTPQKFAETFAARFADVPGLSVEVWDEGRIADEHLGGLLGVSRGSTEPPRLVRVEYEPRDPLVVDGRVPHLVLVGKGITFDSGGLSLKPAGGMETMKTDMGGAAAVLGAVDAAAALGARIRITAITPLTENMPSGSATKPGDVLTVRNGKTIEILNTDAEGRLVLADGLSLAVEAEPDAIVDVATLTGAVVVALGKEIAGLLGNDDVLVEAVRAGAGRAGEPVWPLPLPDDYRAHIESEIADMRNVGRPGQAGSISAALLLAEFVGEVPWVHLDIAGPARSDESIRYLAKGGTGYGVRTLVELATSEEFACSLVRSDGS